jgi:hypothetical protein
MRRPLKGLNRRDQDATVLTELDSFPSLSLYRLALQIFTFWLLLWMLWFILYSSICPGTTAVDGLMLNPRIYWLYLICVLRFIKLLEYVLGYRRLGASLLPCRNKVA